MRPGLDAQTIRLPAGCQRRLSCWLWLPRLNADPAVDGILVQLPLPAHIEPRAVLEAIDPAKDVDGFHPINVGRLADGQAALAPCTPRGVMKLLAHAGVALAGARAHRAGPLRPSSAARWQACCWRPTPP